MFERIETIVDGINSREGAEDRRPNTPKDIWEAIRMLERRPRSAKNLAPMALQKDQSGAADGALCETPTETAEVMVKSLAKTFSQTGTFDQDAVDSVPQRPLQPHLDRPFTEYESRGDAKVLQGDSEQDVVHRELLGRGPRRPAA